jgi:hypothetical protein
MPCLARLRAWRGASGTCDPRYQQVTRSPYGGLCKMIMYATNAKISRSGHPIYSFATDYARILSRLVGGGGILTREVFLGEEGAYGSAVGGGYWTWRRKAGKERHGRALASRRGACMRRAGLRGVARHQQQGGLS